MYLIFVEYSNHNEVLQRHVGLVTVSGTKESATLFIYLLCNQPPIKCVCGPHSSIIKPPFLLSIPTHSPQN